MPATSIRKAQRLSPGTCASGEYPGPITVERPRATADAGPDPAALSTFSFPGSRARAISDATGGPGGVGLALLYPTGVSFAYVNADGTKQSPPASVFPHQTAAGGGDVMSMTNFSGSFVLSLYDSSAHSTQVVASGCQ